METLVVYFKDVAVGELTFDNKNYIYKTYEDGISLAIENAYPLFLHNVDNNFISPYLPESISDWIPQNPNSDLYFEAGILETDSEWEKLVKVSKLALHDENVYVVYKQWLQTKKRNAFCISFFILYPYDNNFLDAFSKHQFGLAIVYHYQYL